MRPGRVSAQEQITYLRELGAVAIADQLERHTSGIDLTDWELPDDWFGPDEVVAAHGRSLEVVATPGHTRGHVVFYDTPAGLLFAGDHVLPTITPSIGFTVPPADEPLGDFMASLTKVRALPDLTILPAHGPVSPSSHARVDQLLEFHDDRLAQSLAALPDGGAAATAHDVAGHLGWTRHLHAFDTLDVFSRGMAAMETKAHLDLLVSQGRAASTDEPDGVRYTRA